MIAAIDRRDVEDIKASGLFDEKWYCEQYPDVAALAMGAVEHFLWVGWRLGRDPGPGFSVREYLGANPDAAGADINPLLHHLRRGSAKAPAPIRFVADTIVPGAENIEFSIVMPTKDRAHCIGQAIDSLLKQTHTKFELIIVDDGSVDGTEQMIRRNYADHIDAERIVYVRCETSSGVCMARNIGLSVAKKAWVTYLDSDNTIRPEFLATFAQGILDNPNARAFYANFKVQGTDKVGGKPFDLKELGRLNFIDIGVFSHHRDCYKVLGGFDPELKRLVDWELIYRFAKVYTPVHLPHIVMDYCNRDASERISRSESYPQARVQVHRKHGFRDTVSIIILSYNQEKYIQRALESVIGQKGWITYEIIIADDGSTDRTPEIINEFCAKYPNLARNISSPFNMGISANFKRCFDAASGEYVAVLEGDDYWDSTENLSKKLQFMKKRRDCSMVFSKTQMLFEKNGKSEIKFLERQEKLKTNRLTGQHFIDDPDMNLIVNFSSCMFRADLMRKLPYRAYTHRLSEITVAFFLEKFGPIGYLDDPLTVYRHHGSGTWSGLNMAEKLRSAMEIREIVKEIADSKYKDQIEEIIQKKYVSRLRELEKAAA